MKTKRWRLRHRLARYPKHRIPDFEKYNMQLELPLNYSVTHEIKKYSDRDAWE